MLTKDTGLNNNKKTKTDLVLEQVAPRCGLYTHFGGKQKDWKIYEPLTGWRASRKETEKVPTTR